MKTSTVLSAGLMAVLLCAAVSYHAPPPQASDQLTIVKMNPFDIAPVIDLSTPAIAVAPSVVPICVDVQHLVLDDNRSARPPLRRAAHASGDSMRVYTAGTAFTLRC